MPHYKRVHYPESIELLPFLTITGIETPHPPPERSSNIKPESPGDVSGNSRAYWRIESTCPSIDFKGAGVFSPHPPPDMRSHTKPVSRRAPSGVSVDCGNVTVGKQSKHLPPLNQRGVGVSRPHPPDRSSVWDPHGHITILNVLKDYGDITGSQRVGHPPPVKYTGAGVQRPELHKRCKVIPAITKACQNIPALQQPKDLPPITIIGVGLHSPHPPSDLTPQIKPEGHDVLPSTSEKKECGNIKQSQKSKLPLINTRGVGALRPHPPDRSSVMDHESHKTVLDLLRDYENITGSQQAAQLSPLNYKGAGVQHPELHKRCKVLPAITKACQNITGPQQYEDISLLHVRGVGLHSPHPPSDFTPQIKPEGHNVLPSTSEKKECGNFKRSQKCKLPSTNLRGLRAEPPQKRIQLWEPSDRPFAFVCKRILEDAKIDREYQNSLSLADRETFSSRFKKMKIDDIRNILWRKKS
ncbi:uncharacterized protein LOC130411324 [Triplophysa dalaica]|uniref:uncharacterized protein LOC130411324 n=1 Tax=Triplophysa dalaica TaxID=1582913 RepID=UPI0024DFADA6|nr:uncharacterized protein LOC130411324 [Triplophysa dalaica]XP_056591840.1 uncharacterized protein LOC130411324 [Triplophysa dalaica]XP_056591841.1 uncharacterized protein LOC130411324 [Triplophysa dalaica]